MPPICLFLLYDRELHPLLLLFVRAVWISFHFIFICFSHCHCALRPSADSARYVRVATTKTFKSDTHRRLSTTPTQETRRMLHPFNSFGSSQQFKHDGGTAIDFSSVVVGSTWPLQLSVGTFSQRIFFVCFVAGTIHIHPMRTCRLHRARSTWLVAVAFSPRPVENSKGEPGLGWILRNILHERMALFSVLTPFTGKRQDDYQIYRSACNCNRNCSSVRYNIRLCRDCSLISLWLVLS